MNFHTANIDRAIVMTQYDLRGFAHSLGFREGYNSSAKSFYFTTANFMAFAAHAVEKGKPTDEAYVSLVWGEEVTYESYLAMCKRLKEDCDLSQAEAIKLLVLQIVRQSEEMKTEVASGKREQSGYLKTLDKSNRWGIAVLALAEAFEVEIPQPTQQKIVDLPKDCAVFPYKVYYVRLKDGVRFTNGEQAVSFISSDDQSALLSVGNALGLVGPPHPAAEEFHRAGVVEIHVGLRKIL
jgi:hypothetical protein